MTIQSPPFGPSVQYESVRGYAWQNELIITEVGFMDCGGYFRVARRASGVKLFREMD